MVSREDEEGGKGENKGMENKILYTHIPISHYKCNYHMLHTHIQQKQDHK